VQWIRKYWAKQWFHYNFVTPEYATKNAVRPPWADIVYKKLHPKTKVEAIQQGFYLCMVRRPMPLKPDPTSMLWCRDDDLFEANYQFASGSATQNKKDYGIDFNPGLAKPRQNGSHEAEPNLVGPFHDFAAFLAHYVEQPASV
jgi:hypothetical protein